MCEQKLKISFQNNKTYILTGIQNQHQFCNHNLKKCQKQTDNLNLELGD